MQVGLSKQHIKRCVELTSHGQLILLASLDKIEVMQQLVNGDQIQVRSLLLLEK